MAVTGYSLDVTLRKSERAVSNRLLLKGCSSETQAADPAGGDLAWP
jgi:hypothetical protein